jgi:hypothetical protein
MGLLQRLFSKGERQAAPVAPRVRVIVTSTIETDPQVYNWVQKPGPPDCWQMPEGAMMLKTGGSQAVVGESHYQEALEQAAGGYTRRGDERRIAMVLAELVQQPDNPHDSNAVAVTVAGNIVGYIARGEAPEWGRFIESFPGKRVMCRAEIRGGWQGSDGSSGSFGITLKVHDDPMSRVPKRATRCGGWTPDPAGVLPLVFDDKWGWDGTRVVSRTPALAG